MRAVRWHARSVGRGAWEGSEGEEREGEESDGEWQARAAASMWAGTLARAEWAIMDMAMEEEKAAERARQALALA